MIFLTFENKICLFGIVGLQIWSGSQGHHGHGNRRPRYQMNARWTILPRIWTQMTMISLLLPNMPRWKSISIILKFFSKTSTNYGNHFRKSENKFCDILWDKLVNVSWGVILKICFKICRKHVFFFKNNLLGLKNAPYLATLKKKIW